MVRVTINIIIRTLISWEILGTRIFIKACINQNCVTRYRKCDEWSVLEIKSKARFRRFLNFWCKISLIEFSKRWNSINIFRWHNTIRWQKLKLISVKSRDSSFLHKMLNLRLFAPTFCASKLRVPTPFNTDICSLDLVHYADNSHRWFGGPTCLKVWKWSVYLEAMLAKMQKTFLRGFGKKIITLLVLQISD